MRVSQIFSLKEHERHEVIEICKSKQKKAIEKAIEINQKYKIQLCTTEISNIMHNKSNSINRWLLNINKQKGHDGQLQLAIPVTTNEIMEKLLTIENLILKLF